MAKRARARDPRDRVRGSVSCSLARFALAFPSFENREKIMPVLQATALLRSTIVAKRFGTPPPPPFSLGFVWNLQLSCDTHS